MTAAEVRPFVHRCLCCGAVFNTLSGHSLAVCAAVLTDRRAAWPSPDLPDATRQQMLAHEAGHYSR